MFSFTNKKVVAYMFKDVKRNYGGKTKIDIFAVDRAGKG